MDTNSIATNVVGALITAAIIGLSKFIWESRSRLKGVAINAAKPMSEIALAALRHTAVMWFLFLQIQLNVFTDKPLTRMSVLLIAFWTWWALFYLVAMLGLIVKPKDLPQND
ncbi:hypothetical protein D3C76_726280 [compost metagenome]